MDYYLGLALISIRNTEAWVSVSMERLEQAWHLGLKPQLFFCIWLAEKSPCASVSKQVLLQNLSYENEFDLHENESTGGKKYSYEWIHINIRFGIEAKGNSEMANCVRNSSNELCTLLQIYFVINGKPVLGL